MATAQAVKKAQKKSVPAKGGMSKPQAKAKSQAQLLKSLDLTPEWDSVPELVGLDFADLVEKRTRLMDEIKFREEQRRELDEQIMAALAVSGVEKVLWEDRPVQIVNSRGASKIVGEKLLSRGVPADVIADCTEPGKEYSYLLVGKAAK